MHRGIGSTHQDFPNVGNDRAGALCQSGPSRIRGTHESDSDSAFIKRLTTNGVELLDAGDLIAAAETLEVAAQFARRMEAEPRERAERNRKIRARRAAKRTASAQR